MKINATNRFPIRLSRTILRLLLQIGVLPTHIASNAQELEKDLNSLSIDLAIKHD